MAGPERGKSNGLSLGRPRGGLHHGTSRNGEGANPPLRLRTADNAIRATDQDAISARLSAIEHRYIAGDKYTRLLAAGGMGGPERRPPIINIGTYLRCRAIDTLVARFLDLSSSSQGMQRKKQIVSIGAGSDARYWRIEQDAHLKSKLHHYVELDFAEVTRAKIERITRHRELADVLAAGNDPNSIEITPDGASLHAPRYTLLATDLRTLPCEQVSEEGAPVKACLEEALDPEADTLILCECVLAYMAPSASDNLLRYIASFCKRPFAVCYEMCVAGDERGLEAEPSRFGNVMLTNLESRNLTMPGSRAFSTLASHAQRFERAFGGQGQPVGKGRAVSLKDVWRGLDDDERTRLSRLEGLDEVEELEMLLAHYAISWYACDADASHPFLQSGL